MQWLKAEEPPLGVPGWRDAGGALSPGPWWALGSWEELGSGAPVPAGPPCPAEASCCLSSGGLRNQRWAGGWGVGVGQVSGDGERLLFPGAFVCGCAKGQREGGGVSPKGDVVQRPLHGRVPARLPLSEFQRTPAPPGGTLLSHKCPKTANDPTGPRFSARTRSPNFSAHLRVKPAALAQLPWAQLHACSALRTRGGGQ